MLMSPIVLVREAYNSLRLCVDYRRLNSKTRRDAFRLRCVDECFDALHGAKFFSTIDLASGYHQVAVHENNRHKTAFTTPFGLFSTLGYLLVFAMGQQLSKDSCRQP